MNLPGDVGPTVEACLAQTWEFLTGSEMSFRVAGDDFAVAEPALHFFIRLSPPAAPWGAGAILSLEAGCLDSPGEIAGEICNVCSGCVRRIFPNRNDLDIGVPVVLGPGQAARLLAGTRIVRCYASEGGNARFLAFESDSPLDLSCTSD